MDTPHPDRTSNDTHLSVGEFPAPLTLLAGLLMAGALAVAPLMGCGADADESPDANAPALTIHGHLFAKPDGGGQPTPLTSADVRAHVDRDGDGSIGGNESARTTSDDEGLYSVGVNAEKGQRVVVEFRRDGFAPIHRSALVESEGSMQFDATLSRIQPLECTAGRCSVEDQSLSIEGLPENFRGNGRTFNPVTEAEAFPGDFSDSEGNLLLSGVFSVVELEDESGERVSDLDDPADLTMRFPRDTWNIVRDMESGNDQIDVPMYSFDEVRGEWIRDGDGVLIDSDRQIIPESELQAIRDKNFPGVIYARAAVDHFSTWNVDWPVPTRTTIRGKLSGDGASGGGIGGGNGGGGNGDGDPGVTITVTGESYGGSSRPTLTNTDGEFCVEVMKSEVADEDVDQNGVEGETHTVRVRAIYQGRYYDLGTVETSQTSSTCDDGTDTGSVDLSLNDSTVLTPEVCELEVDVELLDGSVPDEAVIYAFDETIPDGIFEDLCIDESGSFVCTFSAATDDNGRATIFTPVLTGLYVWGSASGVNPQAESSSRSGTRSTTSCPSQPIALTLNSGFDQFLVDVSVSGDQISWTPDRPMNWLTVSSADDDPKWSITSSPDTFSPPVTYGTVPNGAQQYWPWQGPATGSLTGDDRVYVYGTDITPEGYLEMYDGSTSQ